MHARGDGAVGAQRFAAAAQDGGVARLQAQPGGVGGDVGARLVNDADHAQRHAHAPDADAARALAQFGDGADRIVEARDLLQALGHFFDAGGAEFQPVEQRRRKAVRARLGHVLGVGFEQERRVAPYRRGRGGKGAVLGRAVGAREHARRRARLLAQLAHVQLDVLDFGDCVHGAILPRRGVQVLAGRVIQ